MKQSIYLRTDCAGLRIEIHPTEIVVNFPVLLRHEFNSGGGAEIQAPAIGRECREGLKRVITHKIRVREYFLSLSVHHDHIRRGVKNLYPVGIGSMECLQGAVDREGDVPALGVPSRFS